MSKEKAEMCVLDVPKGWEVRACGGRIHFAPTELAEAESEAELDAKADANLEAAELAEGKKQKGLFKGVLDCDAKVANARAPWDSRGPKPIEVPSETEERPALESLSRDDLIHRARAAEEQVCVWKKDARANAATLTGFLDRLNQHREYYREKILSAYPRDSNRIAYVQALINALDYLDNARTTDDGENHGDPPSGSIREAEVNRNSSAFTTGLK